MSSHRAGETLIAVGNHPHCVYILGASELNEIQAIAVEEMPTRVVFDPSGERFALAFENGGPASCVTFSYKGVVQVYEFIGETWQLDLEWKAHSFFINAIMWNGRSLFTLLAEIADRDRILTASDDKLLRLWDPSTGSQLAQSGKTASPILCISPNTDGKVICGDHHGSVHIFNASLVMKRVFKAHADLVWGVAVSSDGEIYTCGQDGWLKCWSDDGQPRWTLLLKHPIQALVLSEPFVFVGVFGEEARKIDCNTGQIELVFATRHEECMVSACLLFGLVFMLGCATNRRRSRPAVCRLRV